MAQKMDQRIWAEAVGVSFTSISKIEKHRLDFGEYASEQVVLKLAAALDVDADDLLLLPEKIPEPIRQRILERPEVFRKLAVLDAETLDLVLAEAENLGRKGDGRRKPKSH